MSHYMRSMRLTRPRVRKVHGVEIRKLPVGRYLDVMSLMGGMVGELTDALFPKLKPQEILTRLTLMSKDDFLNLLLRLLTVAPEKLLVLIAEVLGTTAEHLREDLTPTELTEVWIAFWAENDLSDFFTNARNVIPRAMRRKAERKDSGCSESSPAESASD